ncbi:hypothetical protein SNOG_08815 [Parastagonospora nodorum SN15]|uniref:Uncharacterized protein n=1 Tax=Phaeosphaeria nodorum (strain SN15 / ATCC MYA-4574 / FGSC 10173) TaxID=321614 RepID=Q0UHE9_PHANO|nr:hypothetical protein SNOG_08815 [Parastagonospora nodorum SN15]EAT83983.1 hypothetical protein SNOG_08815 [Parastagonospora nodorum SN15]
MATALSQEPSHSNQGPERYCGVEHQSIEGAEEKMEISSAFEKGYLDDKDNDIFAPWKTNWPC